MSFFRVLLALIISGGIAYGLYVAVGGTGLERVVEAVRTEISAPADDETPETEAAAPVVDAVDETSAEEIAGDDGPVEAPAALVDDSATTQADAEPMTAATDDEETLVAEAEAESANTTFAARIEDDLDDEADEDAAATEADAPDAEAATGDNDLPRIAAMPAPPETVLPDDAQAPAALEAQDALPAARIEEATGTSTDALDIVNGGMRYVEARETLIAAGWAPRLPATRTGGPNPVENAMIEAGYGELEGCNDAERPICRFEFVDDEKRIAAVLTAGTGTNPSVIDAFLMNIRAE